MEHKSFQDLAITRALSGQFKVALGTYYASREKQIEECGNDPFSPAVNRMDIQIAAVFYLQGEFEKAFKLFSETLERMEKNPAEFADDIFEAKCYLATLHSRKLDKDSAGRLYREMRQQIDALPDADPKKVEFMRNLALSLKQSGELQWSLELFTEVYNSRRNTCDRYADIVEYSHAEVGMAWLEQGRFTEALTILEEVYYILQEERIGGIYYLRGKRHLADAHMYLGLVKIAEDLYKNLVDKFKHVYPFHPEVLATMHNWGRSLTKIGKPTEALAVLNEVYGVRCEQSPTHPDTAKVALDIATIYLNEKQYIDAVVNFMDVAAQTSSTIKWNPDILLHSVTSEASIFDASEDADGKVQLLKAYQHAFTKQYKIRGLSDHHKEVLQSRTRIGELLMSFRNYHEALEVFKDVLEKRTLVLKNDYTDCVDVLRNLANAHYALEQYVAAFEYRSEVYEIQRLITGDNSMEAVTAHSKIMEIANKVEKSVLIDAVVLKYTNSIKAETDSENNADMEDNFPLHVASKTGRIAMVKFLLYKGAIYNKQNSQGRTPADVACNEAVKSFFDFICKLFVAVKADPKRMDRILEIMDDTKLRQDEVKEFPMFLSGEERIECIVDKTLLNARDETGSTPLHLACSNGDARIVKRLLTLEVDTALRDKSNRSPRDVAEAKSFAEIVQLLDVYVSRRSRDLYSAQKNPEIMAEEISDQ